MKTAGRENPNHGVVLPRNQAHGAAGQNRSGSIKCAEKQEKLQPEEMCFFLTSLFIELTIHLNTGGRTDFSFSPALLQVIQRKRNHVPLWDQQYEPEA
jgi:hypothetical protein